MKTVSQIMKKHKLSHNTVYRIIKEGCPVEYVEKDTAGRNRPMMVINEKEFKKFLRKRKHKAEPEEKFCRRCEQTKKISEFSMRSKTSKYRQPYCRKCMSILNKK